MDSIDDRENVDNNSVTTVGGGGSSSIRGGFRIGDGGPLTLLKGPSLSSVFKDSKKHELILFFENNVLPS